MEFFFFSMLTVRKATRSSFAVQPYVKKNYPLVLTDNSLFEEKKEIQRKKRRRLAESGNRNSTKEIIQKLIEETSESLDTLQNTEFISKDINFAHEILTFQNALKNATQKNRLHTILKVQEWIRRSLLSSACEQKKTELDKEKTLHTILPPSFKERSKPLKIPTETENAAFLANFPNSIGGAFLDGSEGRILQWNSAFQQLCCTTTLQNSCLKNVIRFLDIKVCFHMMNEINLLLKNEHDLGYFQGSFTLISSYKRKELHCSYELIRYFQSEKILILFLIFMPLDSQDFNK